MREGRHRRRGGRPQAQGPQLGRGGRPSSRARPGREVRVTWERGGKRFTKTITRSTVSVPVVASQMARAGACKAGIVAPRAVQLGRARRAVRRAEARAEARREGVRPRPARQRRRPRRPRRSSSRARSCAAGRSSRRRAAPSRSATLDATGDPVVPTQPLVVLVDKGHRVGVGDRHRRAAGPPPREGRRDADVRQGRLPGGHRALQRRRARHHRRPVLPAERAQPRRQGRRDRIWYRARREGRGRPQDEEPRRGPGPRARRPGALVPRVARGHGRQPRGEPGRPRDATARSRRASCCSSSTAASSSASRSSSAAAA